ncbi:MAG: hypothetical protein GF350_12275 [Chitinivibrionales bacterium]|nr:hypothetical protein [Chitinivibrionales bacterium]
MRIEVQIDGMGDFLGIRAPFDGALEALRLEGIEGPLSFAEMARARIAAGEASELCTTGAFVREAVVHTETGPTYYVRNSPLLDIERIRSVIHFHNMLEAVQGTERDHSGFGEIYFGDILEKSLFDSIAAYAVEDAGKVPWERRVLTVPQTKSFRIPVERFDKEELTLWLFDGPLKARAYGEFLAKSGIRESPVWLVEWLVPDPARKPFIRQLFFGALKFGSSINGGRRLGFDDGLMGGVWVAKGQ